MGLLKICGAGALARDSLEDFWGRAFARSTASVAGLLSVGQVVGTSLNPAGHSSQIAFGHWARIADAPARRAIQLLAQGVQPWVPVPFYLNERDRAPRGSEP